MSRLWLFVLGLQLLEGGLQVSSSGTEGDFISLLQVSPPTLFQRSSALEGANDSSPFLYFFSRHPEDQIRIRTANTNMKNKQTWLLLELLGAGLLGVDRMFLGGSNIPMGMLKGAVPHRRWQALWNIPSLGTWSTIDRIFIVRNALYEERYVDVLDMHGNFSGHHLHGAYVLGFIAGVASLSVLGIGLILGVYVAWELGPHAWSTKPEWAIISTVSFFGGMNILIALSVPLLALSVPVGLAMLLAQAMSGLLCVTLQSPGSIKVNVVKAMSRELLCCIEADPKRQITRLKIAIRSTLGVPTQMQRLTFQNRPLHDSDTLQDVLTTTRLDYLRGMLALYRGPTSLEVGMSVDEPTTIISKGSHDWEACINNEVVVPPDSKNFDADGTTGGTATADM